MRLRLRLYSWTNLLLAGGMIVWMFVFVSFLKRSSDHVDIDRYPALLDRLRNDNWVTLRDGKNSTKVYTRESPLLFITGAPRSGVNLLRLLLDAHPEIRCAPESGLPKNVLGYRAFIQNHPVEVERLDSAGISSEIMNVAFADFLLQIFARQGDASDLVCVAERTNAENYGYLDLFYPNAKFIHIIRDGRAVASSLVSRKIELRGDGYSTDDFVLNLDVWNKMERGLLKQCVHAGDEKCMAVYYELLVQEPERWLRTIFQFLNVSWNDRVLRHHTLIADKSIKLTKYEENKEALSQPISSTFNSAWAARLTEELRIQALTNAPTLKLLGYDRIKIASNLVDYSAIDDHLQEIQRNWKMTLE